MILLTMLLIPTLVAIGFLVFGGRSVTLKEFLVQLATQAFFMLCVTYGISCQNTSDVQVLNGRVTSKERLRVGCRHSYSCNCHQSCSGSGKSRSCYTVCQTCYEHSYDVDWDVHTSIGHTVSINTVDRQGLVEPPRWTSVVIGEPFSTSSTYTNYVKASPDSLFRHQGLVEKFKDKIPQYPSDIYDYYRLDRLVQLGISLSDAREWNKVISEYNADLGAAKQTNIVVVITKDMPQEYYYALEQAWIGAKKNDVVVVINVDAGLNITWTDVMAWTDNKIFQVKLRDDINSVKILNREKIMDAVKVNVTSNYVRKHMKDFEYLKGLVKPTQGQWLFAMIFGLILSVGLGVFFYKQDVFNEE